MEETKELDHRHSEYTMDSFIPNSKSSDLMKPETDDDDDEARKPLGLQFELGLKYQQKKLIQFNICFRRFRCVQ